MFKKTKTLLLGALVLPALFMVGCDDHTHSLTKVDAVDSTCTTAGNTAYYACDCGSYFSDAEGKTSVAKDSWIIEALGHSDYNEDGVCDECRNGEVARIGNNSYSTLTAAYEAAPANSTIKLMADVDLETKITVSKNIIIDLNGKTITAVNDTAGDGLFMVVGTATLTINGDGTLNSATQANPWGMAIFAKDTARVVINGGTFTNKGTCHVDYDEHNNPVKCNNEVIYARDNAIITINGGTFIGNLDNPDYGAKYTLNLRDGHTTAVILVRGGTFVEFNPAEAITEPAPDVPHNFVDEGYTVVVDGDNYTVVPVED